MVTTNAISSANANVTATETGKNDSLKDLETKYAASKVAMQESKENLASCLRNYKKVQTEYAATDPFKVNQAKSDYQKYNSQYAEADSYNTFLNRQLFDAYLSSGGMNFVG